MPKCTFCGLVMVPATGKMYVQNDGKILFFCSRKCEKNTLKLKRKFFKTKWSSRYQKKGKTVE